MKEDKIIREARQRVGCKEGQSPGVEAAGRQEEDSRDKGGCKRAREIEKESPSAASGA